MTSNEANNEPPLDLDELEARLDLVLLELDSLERNIGEALAAHAALLAHSALRPAADRLLAADAVASPAKQAA